MEKKNTATELAKVVIGLGLGAFIAIFPAAFLMPAAWALGFSMWAAGLVSLMIGFVAGLVLMGRKSVDIKVTVTKL
jgi:VIT1/CCC1 family predicted Fe2+/Mn2+ transporter